MSDEVQYEAWTDRDLDEAFDRLIQIVDILAKTNESLQKTVENQQLRIKALEAHAKVVDEELIVLREAVEAIKILAHFNRH